MEVGGWELEDGGWAPLDIDGVTWLRICVQMRNSSVSMASQQLPHSFLPLTLRGTSGGGSSGSPSRCLGVIAPSCTPPPAAAADFAVDGRLPEAEDGPFLRFCTQGDWPHFTGLDISRDFHPSPPGRTADAFSSWPQRPSSRRMRRPAASHHCNPQLAWLKFPPPESPLPMLPPLLR